MSAARLLRRCVQHVAAVELRRVVQARVGDAVVHRILQPLLRLPYLCSTPVVSGLLAYLVSVLQSLNHIILTRKTQKKRKCPG